MSEENAVAFAGLSCRFDGIPFDFVVERGYQNRMYVDAIDLVETVDGSWHQAFDCTRVYTTGEGTHSGSEFRWYSDESLAYATDNEEIYHCDRRDVYVLEEFARYCERSGKYEHVNDVERYCGDYYLSDEIVHDGNGIPFLEGDDDYVYCEDQSDYYHSSDCHYCEAADGYVYGEEDYCCCSNEGSERVHSYHDSGIRPDLHDGSSPWMVGFEVEKNSVHGASQTGDHIEDSSLFAYWESDSSCGIEGITHAYDPLCPTTVSKFKTHVNECRSYLDAASDNTCGGHINISSQHHTSRELLQQFRLYAPLWYAVYRHRLNCDYCSCDKKIEDGNIKRSPVTTKSFGIEIRLPSGVRNADQLLRRFEWVGVTCQSMSDGLSFNKYVKACRPVLFEGAYEGNRAKYANALRLARKFRVWMLDGIADSSITKWV